MFEKILVPLDGSKLARQVFPHVVELTRASDSKVILIGICESDESEYGQVCRLYIGGEAEKLRQDMGAGSRVSIKTEVLVGKSADEILGYADRSDVDLIVMVSHGRSGIMPWSLGSTVTKVLHRVNIPLLIVRAKEKPLESDRVGLFNKILIPLDGSEASMRVLAYVIEITKRVESEVTLLQVVPSGKHVHTVGGLDFVKFIDLDISRVKEKAQNYLDRAGAEFAGTKAKLKTELRLGDARREIINYARNTDCRLIAMASHGYSSFERWVHGSISYKILQAGEKSALIVSLLGAAK